jgi:hypothetical protein
MAKGIAISIAAETKPFLQGVQKGIIEPLEDAADILQDLGQDGGRDFDKLEKSMRDAQDETDDTRKAFADLQKEIAETGKKSRTDFAKPVKESTDKVSENLREVGSEAKANAAEMFSSFDGSFESIADAAQGTLGGLVGSLGGIGGMAVAAAGAAGLGLIAAELTKQKDLADELKEGLTSAYQEAAAEGRDYLTEAQIIARANEIIFNPDLFKKQAENAKTLGVDVATVIRAQAGDVEALAVISAIALQAEEDRLAATAGYQSTGAEAALITQAQDIENVAKEYAGVAGQMKENAELGRVAIQVTEDIETAARDQIARTRKTDEDRWNALGVKYSEAAARPSVEVRFEPTLPSDEIIRQRLQAAARRQSIQIPFSAVTRNGTVVF